jgi:hypothetical protein
VVGIDLELVRRRACCGGPHEAQVPRIICCDCTYLISYSIASLTPQCECFLIISSGVAGQAPEGT